MGDQIVERLLTVIADLAKPEEDLKQMTIRFCRASVWLVVTVLIPTQKTLTFCLQRFVLLALVRLEVNAMNIFGDVR